MENYFQNVTNVQADLKAEHEDLPISSDLALKTAETESVSGPGSPARPGMSREINFGEGKNKSSRKRKSKSIQEVRKKRKKMKKICKTPRLGYTVQEGEDMLLIISNVDQYDSKWVPIKKPTKKQKKAYKGGSKLNVTRRKRQKSDSRLQEGDTTRVVQCSGAGSDDRDRWGQTIPVEILVKIFQLVVHQDGAIPFLCRVSRVCQLWNGASANPVLWRNVTVSYCWIEPGKIQLPKMELRIKNTVNWLAQNRFSQLREFSLCHWKKHVNYVMEVISQSCPQLTSLKLTYCSGVTAEVLQNLGKGCPELESLNLQYSEVKIEGLVHFLEVYGSKIKNLLITYGIKTERLIAVISKSCCPDLQLLEINTRLDSGFCHLPICIQVLQSGCPKLKVFRMLNVTLMPKVARKGTVSTQGFTQLEELCLATSSVSFVKDQDLWALLHGSTHLRVLDLRGCCRITPTILSTLPCEELECLYWGLYFSNDSIISSKKGIHILTKKWNRTLRELDLSDQPFPGEDLGIAVGHLAFGVDCDVLRSLNLSGTKITASALRPVIAHCSELTYLNLTSCRYLPRGLKKVYRSQEDIKPLLDKLI